MSISTILKNPWVIFSSIILGALVGIYAKPSLIVLKPLATSYLTLLVFCIFPIIFTAIIYNLANILKKPSLRSRLKMIILIFLLGIFIPSAVGIFFGSINQTQQELSAHSQIQLGRMVKSVDFYSEKKSTDMLTQEKESKLSTFFQAVTPSNFFLDIKEGLTIKTILVALLLGIALGLFKESGIVENFLKYLWLLHDLFNEIFLWLLLAMPFGLIAIFASALGTIDFSLLRALSSMILYLTLASATLLIIYIIIIRLSTKESFNAVLHEMKKPLTIAFIFRSTLIPIPSAIKACEELHMDKEITKSIFPVGIIFNRHGEILLFSMVTLFIAKFYYPEMTWSMLFLIWFLSSLIGTTGQSDPASAVVSLGFILQTVGVPIDLAMLILAVIVPVVDRIINMVTVLANCALVSLTSRRQQGVGFKESP